MCKNNQSFFNLINSYYKLLVLNFMYVIYIIGYFKILKNFNVVIDYQTKFNRLLNI